MDRAELFYATIADLYANTSLRPLALALTLAMGVALLALPKKYAVVPILLVMLLITNLQRIVVLTLDFSMIRIMVLFGWLRVILRRETTNWHRTNVDAAMLVFGISQIVFYTLQRRTLSAFITSLGGAFDLIGLYFLFRLLILNFSQAATLLRILCFLVVPIAMLMIIEQYTGRNLFSVFGGVPEFTYIREGRLRSQASFQHPILAGTFGATLVPLFAGMFRMGKEARRGAVVGILAGVIITISSSSSGPILALLMGVIGLFFWRFSRHMREIRLLLVLMIIGLQLSMKAPIYALIARVSIVGGSTAYYRYFLIDQFFQRFRDWWLMGVRSTAYWGEGLFDITNEYIRVAVDSGLFTLLLFLLVIVATYREIGWSLRLLIVQHRDIERFFMWGLGAALFSHLVSFISVGYFDQIIVMWYLLLAMITTLSQQTMLNEPNKAVMRLVFD